MVTFLGGIVLESTCMVVLS